MHTIKPVPNNMAQGIRCRNGSLSFKTTGIGIITTQKSLKVLMIPATRMWIASLIQCCGSNERVQYSDTGLNDIRRNATRYSGKACLQVFMTTTQNIIDSMDMSIIE
jgi:hypothetical protein